MQRTLTLTILSLLLGLTVSAPAADYPEPSPYPTTWEITLDYKTPRRIVVNIPGTATPKAYWYMPYSITNEGEETQTFLPQFDLLTEDGKLHRAGNNVPRLVFDAIRGRERSNLMLPPTQAGGELRPGVDQARDSVAAWEEPSKDMGTFKIFVGGLSGEFVELKDDKGALLKDAKGEPIIVRKTLQLTYSTNGDEVFPGEDPVHEGEGRISRNAKTWVMR